MNKISGIYKIVNNVNGKTYVGSSVNIERRWSQHRTIERKTIIHYAIKKYGEINFEFSILEYCKKESLIEREQYYYDLLKPDYNMMRPIENPMDNPLVIKRHLYIMNRPDIKEKFRKASTISWNNMTDETKKHILATSHTDEANAKRIKSTNTPEFVDAQRKSMKSIWANEEYKKVQGPIRAKIIKEIMVRDDVRKKLSVSGKLRWEDKEYRNSIISQTTALKRKVVFLNDGDTIHEFDSISECGRWIALNKKVGEVAVRVSVSGVINGYLKSVYGYNVSLSPDVKPFIKTKRVVNNPCKDHLKAVVMLDKEMGFIREFESTAEAGRFINVLRENISRVCKGKMQTSGGYKWMYATDYHVNNKLPQLAFAF